MIPAALALACSAPTTEVPAAVGLPVAASTLADRQEPTAGPANPMPAPQATPIPTTAPA